MNFDDLVAIYENKKREFGEDAFAHISEIFDEAKEIHARDAKERGIRDIDQSWRSFKGHSLEKLIAHIIADGVAKLGLKTISGNVLERKIFDSDDELAQVKRNISINYGEFGLSLPDADIVIYEPETCRVVAILSSKVTLRKRVTETGYWKMKLANQVLTKHIKVFFITLDEDETLNSRKNIKKGRAVCEVDTDGCYVLTTAEIETSKKVKYFSDFLNDLKKTRSEK